MGETLEFESEMMVDGLKRVREAIQAVDERIEDVCLHFPEYACLRTMMLEPRNPTMWNSLALVYMMTGRLKDAQDAIERSLDLDSSLASTLN